VLGEIDPTHSNGDIVNHCMVNSIIAYTCIFEKFSPACIYQAWLVS
jgi:hypothetical protein